MQHDQQSLKVPYTAAQMYALVNDVEQYPDFLSWCSRGRVLQYDEHRMLAELELNIAGLRQAIQTENHLQLDAMIDMRLVKGPFHHFHGIWRFQDQADGGCWVMFELNFEIKNRLVKAVASRLLKMIAQTMVSSFLRRAEQIYGA